MTDFVIFVIFIIVVFFLGFLLDFSKDILSPKEADRSLIVKDSISMSQVMSLVIIVAGNHPSGHRWP